MKYWGFTWGWVRFKPVASFRLLAFIIEPWVCCHSVLSCTSAIWNEKLHPSPDFSTAAAHFTWHPQLLHSKCTLQSLLLSQSLCWLASCWMAASGTGSESHLHHRCLATPPPTLFAFTCSLQPSRSLHCRRASNPHLGVIQSLVPVVMLAWFHYDV